MNFNDPEIRQRVISHITFAIQAVHVAIPDIKENSTEATEEKMMRDVVNGLRNPIIMQLLSFTLNLDYELKNSLAGSPKIGG